MQAPGHGYRPGHSSREAAGVGSAVVERGRRFRPEREPDPPPAGQVRSDVRAEHAVHLSAGWVQAEDLSYMCDNDGESTAYVVTCMHSLGREKDQSKEKAELTYVVGAFSQNLRSFWDGLASYLCVAYGIWTMYLLLRVHHIIFGYYYQLETKSKLCYHAKSTDAPTLRANI